LSLIGQDYIALQQHVEGVHPKSKSASKISRGYIQKRCTPCVSVFTVQTSHAFTKQRQLNDQTHGRFPG